MTQIGLNGKPPSRASVPKPSDLVHVRGPMGIYSSDSWRRLPLWINRVERPWRVTRSVAPLDPTSKSGFVPWPGHRHSNTTPRTVRRTDSFFLSFCFSFCAWKDVTAGVCRNDYSLLKSAEAQVDLADSTWLTGSNCSCRAVYLSQQCGRSTDSVLYEQRMTVIPVSEIFI